MPPHTPGSIVMAGHASWIDDMIAMSIYGCNFVGKESVKKIPILGEVMNIHGMLFVNRAGNEAERN